MNLSKKLTEFSRCYHKLHTIHLKRIGLTDDFNKIKNDPLLAIFYFTVFVHERQGTNPDFQKFHRISIRNSLNGKDFSSQIINNKDFPDSVWKKFEVLTNNRPNEKITRGGISDILKEMQKKREPNIITLLSEKDLVDAHKFLLSIRGIGDKISAFLLRNFQHFLKLWTVSDEEKYMLQPVDRWVRRFSELCWPNEKWVDGKHNVNAKIIVKCCIKDDINPISFNQGAWFVGSHYTDLWRFHNINTKDPISEEESVNIKKCIMKFNENRVISAIENFEKLKEKGDIFVV